MERCETFIGTRCVLAAGHDGSHTDASETARREGVIEGLERALKITREYPFTHISNEIRAEIDRLRGEKP